LATDKGKRGARKKTEKEDQKKKMIDNHCSTDFFQKKGGNGRFERGKAMRKTA